MGPSAGLVTALNKMREMSVKEGSIYHQYIPVVDSDTDIAKFGQPILDSNLTPVYNEFFHLLKRIAFTAIETKRFNNPLAQLEGDNIPLGYAGQNIYINPAKGRKFNVEDFAGLLQKYEAEVAVEYLNVNLDIQYPVTLTRAKIKNAFTSWGALEEFVMGIINSLYNAAQIDAYRYTKDLVTAAYYDGRANVEVIDAPVSEATGKAFVKKMRSLYRHFQLPSTEYNAWKKVNGDDAKAITTWSDPSDIMVMLTADAEANMDVDVLAAAFNMDKADFLGRVIIVDNFDVYDDEGTKVKDGSKIIGAIFDKAWFKIKTQDYEMDEFYNPNNRTWQYFLNVNKMYNLSLFANAKILATEAAPVESDQITANPTSFTFSPGDEKVVDVTKTSGLIDEDLAVEVAGTDTITTTIDNENLTITFVAGYDTIAGDYVATITCGDAEPVNVTITVNAPPTTSLTSSVASVTINSLGQKKTITLKRLPIGSQDTITYAIDSESEKFTFNLLPMTFDGRTGQWQNKFEITQNEQCDNRNKTLSFVCGDGTVDVTLTAR